LPLAFIYRAFGAFEVKCCESRAYGGDTAATMVEKYLDSAALKNRVHVMRYVMIIETGKKNYSAYLPDLPGCIATGKTLDEVRQRMQKRLNFTVQACVRMDCQFRNQRVLSIM
jgi:predicted RNase H-like HicB family nuclease